MTKVLGTNIKIKLDEHVSTALDLTGISLSRETGEVIGIGEKVTLPLTVGDKVAFKSWGVDCVEIGTDKYYYIAEETGAIKEIL